jgi:hypothetical protein
MAIVSRLITTFTKVTTCKRKPKEDLNQFTSRFWGLAADHLMHANASTSSQTAEILAIILLNNALLTDETLTAANLELIRIAESRQVSSPNSKEDVTNEDITELRQAISSLDKRVSSDYNKIAKDADANDLEVTRRSTLRKVHSVLNRTKSTLGSLITQRSLIIRPSPYSDLVGQRLEFWLDDAIHVLKYLDQSATTIDSSRTSEQIEAMVESRFQRAMLKARTSSIGEQPAEKELRNLIDSKNQNTLLGATHTRSEF